jgi:hypothetical protein
MDIADDDWSCRHFREQLVSYRFGIGASKDKTTRVQAEVGSPSIQQELTISGGIIRNREIIDSLATWRN